MELAISTASSKRREFHQADYGAEDFFARDAHSWFDAREDGGLEECAVGVSARSERVSAAKELRAFVLRNPYVLLRGFDLVGVDLRSDFDGLIESVADF